MIGVLILTHSFLGNALIQTAEQLLGPQDALKAIDINGTFDHATKWNIFRKTIQSLDEGDGVLVFTDLFGSAASNLAIAGMGTENIEIVMGVNVPILMYVLENRHRIELKDLALKAVETGKNSVQKVATLMTKDDIILEVPMPFPQASLSISENPSLKHP